MSNLSETLNGISSTHEIMSNPLRLLILGIILAKGPCSWTEIVDELKSKLQKNVNPNSVSFHLKRLQESGFVKVSGSDYEPDMRAKEFSGELNLVVKQLKE